MTLAELLPIIAVWIVAVGSPGPANLTLISTALGSGRRAALGVASGIITGSITWATAAGLGLGAIMLAHAWTVEVLRYLGAAYLMYLAIRSARAAFRSKHHEIEPTRGDIGFRKGYLKGAAVHLTNPKAIFFWGSLFAVVVSPDAPARDLLTVGLACIATSITVVFAYAFLFSTRRAAAAYLKLQRVFDGLFAALFGGAALSILTMRFA
jgi:threonine efflux protein